MTRKIMVLCVAAVLILTLAGFGFAKWSDTVVINTQAQSGELKWGILENSVFQMDNGPDYHSEMGGGMLDVYPDPEGKNVGQTQCSLLDQDNDGAKDALNVEVENAYPCYFNEINFDVRNFGTIPLIIQHPQLTWGNTNQTLDSGIVYYLFKNGEVRSELDLDGVELTEDGAPQDAVIELCFQDNISAQQHPNQTLSESLSFHVLQPADQSTTYNFTLSIEGVQWNESPIAANSAY
ncbi:MAG: hypothetical protein HPY90_11155 [Syntrophothermus sp.]|uniref:hypothetical protein n=1 Tax=Syntrophothermus sp. TaxID=2736299 RepID=UPI00257B9110|nr:hypothetical protein [Syntrophothermus sp.]NSW83807.1 hypothetical protein [Syntrophothermus sp.]